MAKITTHPQITLEITFTVNEQEARALDGLTGYNMDEFLKFFYEHMGSHYLKPHEEGLRTFFESIREIVRPELAKVDAVRTGLSLKHRKD